MWFLLACQTSTPKEEISPVDDDGDGFIEPEDCDDTDPYTFPGSAPKNSGYACMRDRDEDDFGDKIIRPDIEPGTDCDDQEQQCKP